VIFQCNGLENSGAQKEKGEKRKAARGRLLLQRKDAL
jgi:hypothetical protein